MAKVEGLNKVIAALNKRLAAASKDSNVSVIVGYTANYAVYVHEDMTAQHKPGKQAKFLEQPARENAQEYAKIIREELQKRRTLAQALLKAGLKLQRDSMMLVPIDTGALRASAFTLLENK